LPSIVALRKFAANELRVRIIRRSDVIHIGFCIVPRLVPQVLRGTLREAPAVPRCAVSDREADAWSVYSSTKEGYKIVRADPSGQVTPLERLRHIASDAHAHDLDAELVVIVPP
jgi:hypothetical protein